MGGLCRVVLSILVVYISISVFECGWVGEAAGAGKVELGLYYETLCPYCSNFIVKNLASIFRNGLLDIIQLNLVPYGNARLDSDNNITCQHGPYECLLNTVEACVISTFPDVHKHFAFIYCVESLVVEQKFAQWESCFQQTGLDSQPVVDCYNSGYGKKLELQYAAETNALEPPHKFVPWVLVDGQPLYEDYQNFAAYVCKAYKGDLPKACKALPIEMQERKLNQFKPVSYFRETTHSSAVSVSQMEIKRPVHN
ncbi:hypothetical protein MRB53_000649 [Persea americana]|uniref:Uncharacterized protein n=1 Tax=Persea americana TaxID=3435 RepID=A0ACC2MPL3_PERAE|nr:hypothetical protein MRB53_000649 [Persea americana]|eukprot:TRINITY_DN1040_c0_g1_i1.p1 TRINITY_DN1040_c0_g1~~TRINITY_DN1040_c0_g1_i1.p1  ORF type:complete len:254 (+),score=34.57 TRINITY_DN1040_c0_g1_i1:158-919(+)